MFEERNEKSTSTLLKNLNKFFNSHLSFKILWQTRKIRTTFKTKYTNNHRSQLIYQGTCCGSLYIGETKRNLKIRTDEHKNQPMAIYKVKGLLVVKEMDPNRSNFTVCRFKSHRNHTD